MTETIAPDTTIGAVELFVADLKRSKDYYQNSLGFQLLKEEPGRAELGAGGVTLLALNEKPGARQVKGVTGLYHFAVLLPSRKAFARLIYDLAEKEVEVSGVADHGVSEAVYLTDPDGNGIEIYSDRRKGEWPRDDIGRLQMVTEELNIEDLMMELKNGLADWEGLPTNTRIGHVHLHVSDLQSADKFYREILGFELMQRYGSAALFMSAGGYHHHVGLNTWAGEGAPPPPPDAAGLRWFELILPGQEALDAVVGRLQSAGIAYETVNSGILVQDPSQNRIMLKV